MKHISFIAAMLLLQQALCAQVKLPSLISNNMVLQQQSTVALWGWATPGEKVNIAVSWLKKTILVKADKNGKWIASVKTFGAGGPYTITFSATNIITISNVLIGEVWLASGQSNMEFPVGKEEKGWKNGVHNYQTEIPKALYPSIRMIDVPNTVANEEQKDFKGEWMVCRPETVGSFSGVAYFFAKEIYNATGYPVGIINSTWGGTPAESWTKRAVLESDTGFQRILERYQKQCDAYPADSLKYVAALEKWEADTSTKKKGAPKEPVGPNHNKSPSKLYNGMIAPLIPYTLKGIIWYQGESNAERAWQYRRLFPAMMESWRNDWNNKTLPFYFVQITPHKGQNPEIREAQLYTWLTVPHTGMVVITDYGDSSNIHPRNKEVVGQRLSRWALHNEYGRKNIVVSGPVYKNKFTDSNRVTLMFDYADGLYSNTDSMKQFTIAGPDSVFVPAQAMVVENKVIVWSEKVSLPVAVRYCWQNIPAAELYNAAGLPASPFRTDNWKVSTEGKE